MKDIHLRKRLFALLAMLVAGLDAGAQIQVTNRYDFEPTNGVTQTGWTPVTHTTDYTTNNAGFVLSLSHFFSPGSFNRHPSTQSPTNVTGDLVIGYGQGSTTTPTVVFRDIVPAHVTNVIFTIWRSDPGDNYQPLFHTRVSYNGGPLLLVDTGFSGFSFYHTPITYNLALSPVPTNTTLDFYFYDGLLGGTRVRLNGIETIYTIPEPSVLMILSFGTYLFLVRRRR